MLSRGQPWIVGTVLAGMLLLEAMHAHAETSVQELAKLAQDPVGNLISMPFRNNSKPNFGPERNTQDVLNVYLVLRVSSDLPRMQLDAMFQMPPDQCAICDDVTTPIGTR
jgi:hypothetical protein